MKSLAFVYLFALVFFSKIYGEISNEYEKLPSYLEYLELLRQKGAYN